jgi:uncharacterized protein YbjT (DUF2867 family)
MVRTFLLPIAQSAPLSLSILHAATTVHAGTKPLALRVVLSPNAPLVTRELVRDLRVQFPQMLPEKSDYVVDLSKPKEIAEAMEACDGVILSSSSPSSSLTGSDPLLLENEMNLVHAANQVGLRHILKVSCSQGLLGENSSVAFGRAHWQVEQQIREVKGSFDGIVDFVRPTTLMDSFLYGRMHEMVCGQTISVSIKSGKVAFTHPMDVAEAVVKLAQSSNPKKQQGDTIGEFNLTGPEALTYAQVAQIFSEQLGQRVRYSYFPLWAVQMSLWIKGVRPDEISSYIELANALESGAESQVLNGTLQQLLGKDPRSFEQFVSENKDKWSLTSYK